MASFAFCATTVTVDFFAASFAALITATSLSLSIWRCFASFTNSVVCE